MEKQILIDFFEKRLDHYLQILEKMVRQNSFTENPAGINALGEMTFAEFEHLGFTKERVPSVIESYGDHFVFTRPGRLDEVIGLVSHLDTVFPEEEEAANDFSWRKDGDVIYGPGTVDIKGGTVMILMVLEALQKFAPEILDEVTWTILLNAAEERLSEDFGVLARERLTGAKACLVFECGFFGTTSDNFRLVAARKGMAHFHIKVDGLSAHAGVSHEKGANAILEISKLITQVEEFTDYEKQLTYNVGRVQGGVVTNRIPHQAEAFVEMRAYDAHVFEEGIEQVLALAGEGRVKNDNGHACHVEISLSDITGPWSENEGTRRLIGVWQQAAAELGYVVEPENRGGLSDGNQTWLTVPTIDALGPGGGGAHQSEQDPARGKTQEYIYLPSLVPKAVLNAFAIKKLIQGD